MIKALVAAATVAAILASGDGCGDGDTSKGGGYDKAPQYTVLQRRVQSLTFNVKNYQLLVNYPQSQGGAQWVTVSSREWQRCPEFAKYPRCAE